MFESPRFTAPSLHSLERSKLVAIKKALPTVNGMPKRFRSIRALVAQVFTQLGGSGRPPQRALALLRERLDAALLVVAQQLRVGHAGSPARPRA